MKDISDAADLMTTAREALLRDLLPALTGERRYAAKSEHPAPALAGIEGEANQVGNEDPDRHRQLEEADQPAAALRRRRRRRRSALRPRPGPGRSCRGRSRS